MRRDVDLHGWLEHQGDGGIQNLWNNMRASPQFSPFTSSPSSSFSTFFSGNLQRPTTQDSWSQLFLGGGIQEEEEGDGCMCIFAPEEKLEPLEGEHEQVLVDPAMLIHGGGFDNQAAAAATLTAQRRRREEIEDDPLGRIGSAAAPYDAWSHLLLPPLPPPAASSSPCSSSATSFGSKNMTVGFSDAKAAGMIRKNINMVDDSSTHHHECNSEVSCSSKKARLQSGPAQYSPFKVRKARLGDRITALHQLVSPFGKTDTASVLLEAIGYIRFLHRQIQALSSPYMTSSATPGVASDEKAEQKDLRSRGLCLVPVACTFHVEAGCCWPGPVPTDVEGGLR